jgi:hypothetical protein
MLSPRTKSKSISEGLSDDKDKGGTSYLGR